MSDGAWALLDVAVAVGSVAVMTALMFAVYLYNEREWRKLHERLHQKWTNDQEQA